MCFNGPVSPRRDHCIGTSFRIDIPRDSKWLFGGKVDVRDFGQRARAVKDTSALAAEK